MGAVRHGRDDARRRAFDLALAIPLAAIALPIIVLAAVGSAISLKAWPFFTQDRVGRDGQLFQFLKVRTLPVDVPGYIDKHQLDHARIPAFCRLLRTLHLDELPQLFLVVTGRMSLVGPRPEMAYLHAGMDPRFAELRTSVRPGCTGLWQVSESCMQLIGATPEYDTFYLRHRSVRFDLWVLWRTLAKMLRVGTCGTLADVPAWVVAHDLEPQLSALPEAARSESSIALPVAGR